MNKLLSVIAAAILALAGQGILAADAARAEAAAADVLFALDIENASFKVRHDGHVDILFGPGLPDAQYQQAVKALKDHPDIPGVLAGRGSSNFCATP